MRYKIREVSYRDAEISPKEVIPVSEAAKILGLSMPGVIRAIERGVLTEVRDTNATWRGRRLLLRKQVEQIAQERSKNGASPAAGPELDD